MQLLFTLAFLAGFAAHAEVISPSSVEVKFSYESEFETSKTASAHDLVLQHAEYLFGYLQNPEIGAQFGLDNRIGGIGAPRWEPEFTVLSDHYVGPARLIRYEMHGLLLLHRKAAAQLLAQGGWDITLPFDLDHFYDGACEDPGYPGPDQFWYFYYPFKAGCEHLRAEPLAHAATLHLSSLPAVEDHLVGLDVLRGGHNGNGDVFQVAAINGFDDSSTKAKDNGRVNFMAMNAWLRDQGFRQTILQHFKNRPIYLFEKTLTRADGTSLTARVLRLLADTDLDDSKTVTFAKFLKTALEESDVVIYEGHSGAGVSLDLKALEQQLLLSKDPNAGDHVEFNRSKHQIFLFDACSSYSYYLGMFAGKKDPGTLAVMSNGLESQFGSEIPATSHLYRMLFDLDHRTIANDGLTWQELLSTYERPLRGNTFLLNVDLND